MIRLNRTSQPRLTLAFTIVMAIVCMTLAPSSVYADTASELAAARQQLEEIGRASAATSEELGRLTGELEKTRSEIEKTEDEIAKRQEVLSSYVSSEYKLGFTDLLDIVLSSDSFDDLISRVFYMNKVADSQAQTIMEVKDLQTQLAEQQEQQERNIAETQKQVDELNSQRQQAASLVNSLDAQLQEELRAEAEENQDLQAGLDAGDSQAAPEQGTNPDTDENPPVEPPAPQPEEPSKPQKPEGGNPPTIVGGGTIVSRAQGKLGCDYVWGAAGPNAFDCSGLVSYAVTGQYVHYWSTYDIINWPEVSNPQPGDIAVNLAHTGIYIGGGQMIHASNPSTGVIIGPVQGGMKFVRYPG